ncbi:MAG: 3-deoxy-D-manno-octulosonic acid transferase [bacterium]|nr:3-deoxy-D-manno-octulosonic acid transferase [bacterium]
MYPLYTLLFALAGLAMLPRLLWRDLRGAGYHRNLHERFGYGSARHMTLNATQRCLWFHAASVGEVQSLQPVITGLGQRFPHLPVAISTFTPAGKTTAQRAFPDAVAVFLLPLDLPWVMYRLVQRLQPQALIVQETELWPHLFRAVSQHRVPIAVVNGRLSPRAFARYRWGRPFMRRVLSHVSLILAQSEDSADRFLRLGAPSERVHVTGNTNIDRALLAATQPAKPHTLAPLLHKNLIWVAGSTHEGEETTLLNVYRQLQGQHPEIRLVLAPRHLERTTTVVRHVQASGYRALRRSQYASQHEQELEASTVLILDTLGELATLYSLCTVAFVGGSLIPVGGHNLLEPAVYAKPVVFGPYMQHFPDLAVMLCEAGGAIQVQNEADLCRSIDHLLTHPEEGRSMGNQALRALAANQGALHRTTQALTEMLKQKKRAL